MANALLGMQADSDAGDEADPSQEQGAEKLSKNVWVISQTRGGASETLHQIGRCWRRLGVHFVHFHVLDSQEDVFTNLDKDSGKRLYNHVCKDCFPKRLVVGADSETDSGSSSSDS